VHTAPVITLSLALLLIGSGTSLPVLAQQLARQTEPQGMEPLFQLNPTSAADLTTQSRSFPTSDSARVQNAAVQVLQDMGYQVRGGNREIGLLYADKVADVPAAGPGHAIAEAAVIAISILAMALSGQGDIQDLPEQVAQHIYVTLLVVEETAHSSASVRVRLSIDRDMVYDQGYILADHTELPLIYQEFFEKLSKSVFLEAEQI
jgi:hypothetical protein